ncbi:MULTISPECIES: electron transfer flavoprotein subunit beta/FixA family protein [Commensalibacter]|uniref:electron transfer flavoprotein subunit beta/FixA family protein n=1 Tax=Commensalibacter TaxID=1079922 RepID=UPI0018DDA34A|nr:MULTISPECIES: electron transfer flavoprotein subunit beta/FixA family protein [Commensalibacter]MBH9973611.1 electron transfer flavoprotein subunit beta/FixA family protein [Commensalibacter melissae]MBI0017241.1 electron transfer flavoprotein subunit beta/FixA family protein [Commensalibacter sp. B14384M2]MBI0019037.1 electron transfer flavoprotein subunit beta/FixA family protein [Commensalibacter sp. W8133]MBI0049463.1 electron transfer flavoprotein subunit beta/FixA family protein [Comme
MKVIVPVKRVVDSNIKPLIKSDGSDVEINGVKMSMNPFDETAVEEAVRLKEKKIVSEIVVVSIGEAKCQDTLRTAMAMGADRGILVTTDKAVESLTVAKILQHFVDREKPDLVLMGKQASDDDMNATGQILAAKLGWGQGTFVSKLELSNGHAKIAREVDDGQEILELTLPAVITTDLRLNEPRYASLPNIMKARKKPLETVALSELGIEAKKHLEVISVKESSSSRESVIVDSVDALLDKLKNEAKVI